MHRPILILRINIISLTEFNTI